MTALRNYVDRRPTRNPWTADRHTECRLRVVRKPSSEWIFERSRKPRDLATLLQGLMLPAVGDRLALMREGRENVVLEREPLVLELAAALATDGAAMASAELFLDEIFESLVPGERFEHIEVVIALLYALERSGRTDRGAIIDPFTGSRAAEIAQIARFARRLKNGL